MRWTPAYIQNFLAALNNLNPMENLNNIRRLSTLALQSGV